MNHKYASDMPLPGGVEQYFDTLVTLLRRVSKDAMCQAQLTQTVIEVCPKASKSTAINMYINLVSRMGLWSSKDDVFRLTAEGESLLELADSDPAEARLTILKRKLSDVAGYDHLLCFLADGPTTFDQLDAQIKQRLNANWKSKNQTTFRLNWLRSLGYVSKNGHEYGLTEVGSQMLASGGVEIEMSGDGDKKGKRSIKHREPPSLLVSRATDIADRIKKAATVGGDGKELENATAEAFELLGYSVQVISGPGNPDVVSTAVMGEDTYRLLIETKSRSSGVVNQNDVNFNALNQHKAKANADFVLVLATDFSGGNLEQWASEHQVRLLRVEEICKVLLAHAEAAIPLDSLRELFVGSGSTDESALSAILADAETSVQLMALCRDVYDAVFNYQDEEATLNEHSLYYILGAAHSIRSICATTELLHSGLLAALGRTDNGGLFCRLSHRTLSDRLCQIKDVIGGRPDAVTK
ncbi:MAG: restriction endonuclease [Planctomycetes bacterium]|nr:restriction endonuclease [Planctomycetota bacterium]